MLTIHQPRLEIFHMFDRILLLCQGEVGCVCLYVSVCLSVSLCVRADWGVNTGGSACAETHWAMN